MKFGVFTESHTRIASTETAQYSFGHYEGQMVVTDGEECFTLDDYWANIGENRLKEVFNKMKSIHANSTRKTPRIDWFNFEELPIQWFDDYSEALSSVKPLGSLTLVSNVDPK